MPSEGVSGTLPFVSTNVEFTPAGFTGRVTDDWASVPYCETDFASYGDKTVDHLAAVHNPATGVGDICRYTGVVDGATWRIPTAAEWAELYGSDQPNKGQTVKLGTWTSDNYYQLSGHAMGPNQNNIAINSNGVNARVTNADPYTNGAVFLPASGCRGSNGLIWNIGSWGNYWSSTTSTIDLGYEIQFSSSNVYPQQLNSRTYGFSVRCIRE